MDIVFDIGGTNMRVAGVKGDVLFDELIERTPKTFEEGIRNLIDAAHHIAGDEPVTAAAGSVSGTVEDGVISDARNLPLWQGHNIDDALSRAFNVPVRVVNDAAAAGLGEACDGSGRGATSVLYVTVSTGVGGAFVVNGRIEAAGGMGHVEVGGSDLESQISGTAVKGKFGIEPKDLDSIEERNKLADILAEGLALLATTWKPERIVLGGSMITGVNPIPLDRTKEQFASRVGNSPDIVMAFLGDERGLRGALRLLR